jgi:alpha-tubulin suppressor-like RCC1 family protein
MRRLRFRTSVLVVFGALGTFVAACGFGVDLDNLFGAGNDGGTNNPDALADGSSDPDASIPKVQVVQLGAGDNFACGRRVDGTVMCWGRGDDGRLGDGNANDAAKPILVRDIADAIDLAVGDDHSCIVRKSGTVSCWGENQYGQIGNGTTNEARLPLPVTGLVDAEKVFVGGESSCALKKDHTVVCWGNNTSGQLGDGTLEERHQPVAVKNLTNVKTLALGFATACALLDSGDVHCWGDNDEGQAGSGTPGTDLKEPAKVPSLAGVTAIGSGPSSGHVCAVLASGAVQCWGYGERGALGNSKTDAINVTPQAVVGLNDAVSVTTGDRFSCAVKKTGAVTCFGNNEWRTLGLGDGSNPITATTPVPVEKLVSGVQEVRAGGTFACALHGDGQNVSCWGTNIHHVLGRNTRTSSDVPVKITAPAMGSLALGREHSCAVDKQGGLHCWGMNVYRQQSTSAFPITGTPTAVTVVNGVVRATGGDIHTCAQVANEIRCWGHGDYGQLGNGQEPYIQGPPVVFNAPAATDIGAGYHFTCALLSQSKQVYCAGLNEDTRLGRYGGDQSTPVPVMNPTPPPVDAGPDADAGPPPQATPFDNVDALAVGRLHSCVIHSGGKVSCWGTNYNGQLGVASGPRANPFEVPLGATAIAVAAGEAHTCAIVEGGTIRCWGRNVNGQVSGNGSSGPALRTPDLAGKTATAITAGDDHTCALLNDQSVVCWGANSRGQLGNGSRAEANQPVPVKDLTGVVAIMADADRSCALQADGALYCWGNNRVGELGDGALMVTGSPAPVAGY